MSTRPAAPSATPAVRPVRRGATGAPEADTSARASAASERASDIAARASDIAALAARATVAHALELVDVTDDRTVADMIELVSIPAPTFHELDRARRVRDRFVESGLPRAEIDAAGNVVARMAGAAADLRPVIVAAHLDTVFEAGVDLVVREDAGRLCAPGIADNARGLAALLALGRALLASGVRPRRPILLVATTGEEGRGDLRGVKHLFQERSPLREAAAFIALDGTGARRIVHRAVGSRRLRIDIDGVGGHSWGDRGLANPAHAVGRAIANLAALIEPDARDVALSVGRLGGGTSVNAVPEQAWLELDIRAESGASLDRIEARARAAVHGAVAAEIAARPMEPDALELRVTVIGDRPTGETPATNALVRTACAATTYFGAAPDLIAASTDANVPIALGIPAIAIGAGGESGRTHTTAEWYSNQGGVTGVQRALLVLLAVAGIAD